MSLTNETRRVRCINDTLGMPVDFENLAAMEDAVHELDELNPGEGYWPEDGLQEGRDFEYIEGLTRFIAWTGRGEEAVFGTAEEAHAYMVDNGLEPTGEWASDAETEGGRILWQGYQNFYGVRDGNGGWKEQPEGCEPRVRVLCSREEADDGD